MAAGATFRARLEIGSVVEEGDGKEMEWEGGIGGAKEKGELILVLGGRRLQAEGWGSADGRVLGLGGSAV